LVVTQAISQTPQIPTINDVAKDVKDALSKAKTADDIKLIRQWCEDRIRGISAPHRISILKRMQGLVEADKPTDTNKLLDKVTALDKNDEAR